MKRQHKFTKNCCWKVENTKLSMFISLCVTIKWSITMSVYKYCQATKHSILRVFLLRTSKPAIIIKFILEKMLRKF